MRKIIFLSVCALLLIPSFALAGNVTKDGCWNGIKLYRRVQIVNSFPDIKVKVVNSFPNLRVKNVNSFPDSPGRWQFVDSFPDFRVQFVDSFPDITIKFVDSFPGVD